MYVSAWLAAIHHTALLFVADELCNISQPSFTVKTVLSTKTTSAAHMCAFFVNHNEKQIVDSVDENKIIFKMMTTKIPDFSSKRQ